MFRGGFGAHIQPIVGRLEVPLDPRQAPSSCLARAQAQGLVALRDGSPTRRPNQDGGRRLIAPATAGCSNEPSPGEQRLVPSSFSPSSKAIGLATEEKPWRTNCTDCDLASARSGHSRAPCDDANFVFLLGPLDSTRLV